MIRIHILVLLITVLSCSMHSSLKLKSKLPADISFKDNSEVFINKLPLGILTVNNLRSNGFEVQIVFKKFTNIPDNSILVYFENPVGPSFFEIITGNSKTNFTNGELVIFKEHYFEKLIKDSLGVKKYQILNKLTGAQRTN